MKWIVSIVCSFLQLSVLAQSKIFLEKYSLYEYAPQISAQDITTNNSNTYAAAYVALTTRKAWKEDHKYPDSTYSYSLGYVDAAIQSLGKSKINSSIGEMYDGYTGMLGDLDYAFYILYKYGTVPFSEFPFTNPRDINAHRNEFNTMKTGLVTIAPPYELITEGTKPTNWIELFKKEIVNGKPIIISIKQPNPDCYWKNLNTYDPVADNNSMQHIVCIIGYNDQSKKFLIKNNYGLDCTEWYKYDDVGKLIQWAYTIDTR